MKKSITVIGVEAEGIRGVRLEEDGAQWVIADGKFWPFGDGAEPSAAASGEPNGNQSQTAPADDEDEAAPKDRYETMV